MFEDVRCSNCGRLLCKRDQEGLVYFRAGKTDPHVIASTNGSKVMIRCQSMIFEGTKKVACGKRTLLEKAQVCLV